jgi:hypothetical protein
MKYVAALISDHQVGESCSLSIYSAFKRAEANRTIIIEIKGPDTHKASY